MGNITARGEDCERNLKIVVFSNITDSGLKGLAERGKQVLISCDLNPGFLILPSRKYFELRCEKESIGNQIKP